MNKPGHVGKYPGHGLLDVGTIEGGGYQPQDHCTNTGDSVLEVLWSKYPKAWPVAVASLYSYKVPPPELVLIDIMDDTVAEVVCWISEGARPGGGGCSHHTSLDPLLWGGQF